MVIEYNCSYNSQQWISIIKSIKNYGSYLGCIIDGRGSSIQVYVGNADGELWVCFPISNLSSTLSNACDIFWNIENLTNIFGNVIDATTVAEAIRVLYKEGMLV